MKGRALSLFVNDPSSVQTLSEMLDTPTEAKPFSVIVASGKAARNRRVIILDVKEPQQVVIDDGEIRTRHGDVRITFVPRTDEGHAVWFELKFEEGLRGQLVENLLASEMYAQPVGQLVA